MPAPVARPAAAHAAPDAGDTLDGLTRSLAATSAARLQRAVALVDALPARGDADALIAPLRPRLARLRPQRPPALVRVLFRPLDPVIVPRESWERGSPGLPRSALTGLARAVRDGWKPAGGLDRIDLAPAASAGDLGAILWEPAGLVLRAAKPPPNWRRTSGLADDDFAPLARAAALVLAHAGTILGETVRHTPQIRLDAVLAPLVRSALTLQAALARPATPRPGAPTQPADFGALATLVAVLLVHAGHGERVLAALESASSDKPVLLAARRGLDFVLDEAVRVASHAALAQAAAAMAHIAALLGDLDSLMQFRPAARQRLTQVGAALDTACRARVAAALDELAGAPATSHAVLDRAGLADDIRNLATAATALGGGEFYAQTLADAAARLAAAPPAGLSAEERARLAATLAAPLPAPDRAS